MSVVLDVLRDSASGVLGTHSLSAEGQPYVDTCDSKGRCAAVRRGAGNRDCSADGLAEVSMVPTSASVFCNGATLV